MNKQAIFLKENIIWSLRQYFHTHNFHEVQTPILQETLPLEPNIYPFSTTWLTSHTAKNFYLTTSPESAIKKYLADAQSNCFSISSAFRNVEETNTTHLPEFLMLEWYRTNTTYLEIMNELQLLIKFICEQCNLTPNFSLTNLWPRRTMAELFQKYLNINLDTLFKNKTLWDFTSQKGYLTNNATWEQLFNQLFLNEIEPRLGTDPIFITDYPAKISPLCKSKTDNPNYAERFELYLGGMEIANGNTENTDASSVRKSFEEEKKFRLRCDMPVPIIDEAFLGALKVMNNTHSAGVGLGIDRLAMIILDKKDIRVFQI